MLKYDIRTGVKKIKTKTALIISGSVLATAGLIMAVVVPLGAKAASTVVVNPGNVQWSTADTRPGGAVNFVSDPSSPAPTGALQLTTDNTTAAKAQYLHAANTPLSGVTDFSYFTKQNSASFAGGAPSYQVLANLNGSSGFTTLVYEPYQGGQGAVVPSVWQQWNIGTTGLFWSSRTVTCSGGTVNGTAGGPATYTIAQINALCPGAVVIGFGVNVGTFNPSYDVETDLVSFNGTTYDFESSPSSLVAPTITSPANGAVLTTAQATKIDWTDTVGVAPVSYQYRAYSDPAYTSLVYDTGPAALGNSEIPTPGTPPGEYYVQVRAFDGNGNVSAWSNDATNPYHITVVPVVSLANKDQCKNNGWKTSNTPVFKNQGDCVSYFATGGRNQANG